MSSPLALSDSQLAAVMDIAKPLAAHERSRFLEMLASKLNGQQHEIGDGTLYRLLRELQRECFSPPEFVQDTSANRSRAYVHRVRGRAG
jgi:hypothetical protein